MIRLCFLSLISFFLFWACEDVTDQTTGAEQRQVFRYNINNVVTSLDPAFARSQANIWVTNHIFDGLVELDGDLNVQPCIAQSWDISEDGLTYTFHLRDDIYFHHDDCFSKGKGRRVLASDVVYSFNRILDKKVASPGSWIFSGRVAEETPFMAPNDSTFVLRLQAPFRPMLGILTMQYCSVVAREAVETYGRAYRSRGIGTGPFKVKNWLENQSLFLSKNEDYFRLEQPYIDAIRVRFIADRKTAYLEVLGEKLDLISGLESSFINELLTYEGELRADKKERLQFFKNPFLNSEYLGINMKLAEGTPLGDKRVRQALNYGFDRQQMLATLRNNVGKPADSGFTPRGLPSYAPEAVPGYRYDPARARQLLAEAGYPNGEGLPELTLLVSPDYQDLCVFIVRQWEDLGVKVKIDIMESATLRQLMRSEQAPFFRASWIADYPDAESFLTVFYSKNPPSPNYTRFSNPQFDQLYEQALLENDDEKRFALYREMEKIVIDEAPVIFLFYDETALVTGKSVLGLDGNALNLLNLEKVHFGTSE